MGKKEEENKSVTLRYNDGKQEFGIPLQDIIARAISLSSDQSK